MRNCLSYWYPKLVEVGLPTPQTEIIHTEVELAHLLDGNLPDGWTKFLGQLSRAATLVGLPCFLRTGHLSDKHEWKRTCYVKALNDLGTHVAKLVEFSMICDFVGRPYDVWVVRELLNVQPIFTAFSGEMPITQEFRYFVRDGEIEHRQPYWPPNSIVKPSVDDWKERLAAISDDAEHREELTDLAIRAGNSVGGFWSIDMLRTTDRGWMVTDMAIGEDSFRWEYTL